MNEWIYERMNERMNERKNERMNEHDKNKKQTKKDWMNEWKLCTLPSCLSLVWQTWVYQEHSELYSWW